MTSPADNYIHFDLEFLREIADQDNFILTEIVNSFLLNAPVHLAELEQAVHADNAQRAVQFAAHKLAGAYSLVGARRLVIIIKGIEVTEDRDSGMAELKEKSELLFDELKQLLSQMDAG